MSAKKVLAYAMMLIGLAHMPLALYLGFTHGMGPEMSAFIIGLLLFWGGFYLNRMFGD